MIPYDEGNFSIDTVAPQPSLTYKLYLDEQHIAGHVDGMDAIRQAVFLMLNIERYQYPMFSWNYGIEMDDLFGMPMDYVQSELKRRIAEALTQDDRIDSVDSFQFSRAGSKLTVTFTVHTVYGDLEADKEVSV